MSIHVCACVHGGRQEFHLRYPGMDEQAAQLLADRINAGHLAPMFLASSMAEKTARNIRVQARYDELMQEGRHGHYETIFRIVREELERAATASPIPSQEVQP